MMPEFVDATLVTGQPINATVASIMPPLPTDRGNLLIACIHLIGSMPIDETISIGGARISGIGFQASGAFQDGAFQTQSQAGPAQWQLQPVIYDSMGVIAWAWRIVDGFEYAPVFQWTTPMQATAQVLALKDVAATPIGATMSMVGALGATLGPLMVTAPYSLALAFLGIEMQGAFDMCTLGTPDGYQMAQIVWPEPELSYFGESMSCYQQTGRESTRTNGITMPSKDMPVVLPMPLHSLYCRPDGTLSPSPPPVIPPHMLGVYDPQPPIPVTPPVPYTTVMRWQGVLIEIMASAAAIGLYSAPQPFRARMR